MADDAKKPVRLTLSQAKRIAAVVKRVEHTYHNSPPPPARGPLNNPNGLRVAKVRSGGIQAASGATMGVGQVELCNVGTDHVATPNGTVITVLNAGGSIAADRFVLIDDGPHFPWVVVDKC